MTKKEAACDSFGRFMYSFLKQSFTERKSKA